MIEFVKSCQLMQNCPRVGEFLICELDGLIVEEAVVKARNALTCLMHGVDFDEDSDVTTGIADMYACLRSNAEGNIEAAVNRD